MQTFAHDVKEVSDSWNLRVCLILSLFLQGFLILVPSLRKRCKSNFLHLLIWFAYFLASWIAAYALGQTVKSPGDDLYDPNKSGEVSLFWAQFLLLHLAGPDSITSFSSGDNGFWLKPLFGLVCQVVATIYSFTLLALAKKNKLWIPTVLVFVVGLIKSYERLKALFNAGFDRFGETLLPEPYPGPDYEESVKIHRTMREVQGGNQPDAIMVPIKYENSYHTKVHDDIDLLLIADSFFEGFKVLFTGSFLSFQDREKSREYFLGRPYSDAFRLIEYELSFLHDLMHTKMAVVQNAFGYVRRIICFFFILAAYILFFQANKQGYDKFDVVLTHALLIGTICFDIIFVAKLIFSDWSIIRGPRTRHLVPTFILKRKRWSRSVFQYDMFNYCLRKCLMRILYKLAGYIFDSKGFMDRMRAMMFSSSETVTKDFEKFIFEEIKMKSLTANDLKAATEACSQRGLSALLRTSDNSYIHLKWSIEEFHYLESLLLWHLATELCYHNLESSLSAERKNQVEFCKFLSHYMFYLLVMQPTMLSPEMGNWSIVLQDTQAEATRFFNKHSISHHVEACQRLLSVETPYRAAAVKGPKSKSLLFDASLLAKELRDLKEKQWEVMSRVWMEFMCFAAIRCSPTVHAQQPSKGGELLTFTWLLMNHLGLGTQFSEQERAHDG